MDIVFCNTCYGYCFLQYLLYVIVFYNNYLKCGQHIFNKGEKMMLPWSTNNNLTDIQFFNRTNEINLISNILKTTEEGSSPDLFVIGVRGVGKTVLMRKILHDFERDYLVIHVDMTKSNNFQKTRFDRQSFMEFFYSRIIKACEEQDLITFDKKLEKLFKTNDISIDKFIKMGDMPIPHFHKENNYQKLAEFVMDLPQRIYEEYSFMLKGVIVFFDEFQKIKNLNEDLDDFLWYLRSSIQDQGNVAYILSGSISIYDQLIEKVAGNKGAFGGRMLTIQIKPFSYSTTKKYLTQGVPDLKFTEDGLKKFYECTRGLPSYINTFANLITRDELLTPDMVKKELKINLNVLVIHYISLWYSLTEQEQEIIIKLVEKPLLRKELAEKLNVTTGSLSKPLVKLQNSLLVEKYENKYKIYDNLFNLWLNEYFLENGIYPYYPE